MRAGESGERKINSMKLKNWRTALQGSEFRVTLICNECPTTSDVADTPERIEAYLRPQLATSIRYNPDSENFGIVCLNTRRRPIGFTLICNGTLDAVTIRAAEIFKPAILMNAAAIVLFHNHPSGDPSPSEADIKMTRSLISAGTLLGVQILDHMACECSPENPSDLPLHFRLMEFSEFCGEVALESIHPSGGAK